MNLLTAATNFTGIIGAGHLAGPNPQLVDMEIARVERTLVYLFNSWPELRGKLKT